MFKSLSTSLIARGILAVIIGVIALAWPSVTVLARLHPPLHLTAAGTGYLRTVLMPTGQAAKTSTAVASAGPAERRRAAGHGVRGAMGDAYG